MESGEIEWFEYKIVLKKQLFVHCMLGISFQQIDNIFWRYKIWKIQLSCKLYGFDLQ